jgi:aminoglycoside/choline kinase family phosphotransferase
LAWTRLAGDGSDKVFWRVNHPGGTAVAADGSGLSPDRRAENRSLALIGRHLAARGLPVPKLLATAEERGFFLMEDLGDDLLADLAGRAGAEGRVALYDQAVATLLDLQFQGLEIGRAHV